MQKQLLVSRHLLSALLFASFLSETQCYKILIYNPLMAHSHVNFFGRIADILVEAGYDVVTYMPELDPLVKMNGTKLARIIRGPHLSNLISIHHTTIGTWSESVENFGRIFQTWKFFADQQTKSCSGQLGDEASMEQLRAEHFDFGITELFSQCGFAVFHKIGLNNYASAFATDLYEMIIDPLGVSGNPSYVPAKYSSSTGINVANYWERVQNVIDYTKMYVTDGYLRKAVTHEDVTKFLPHNFDLKEAIRKSSFAFINSEELLEFPRLLSRKIVFIGGIAVGKPDSLDKEYQKIMNESANGIVLVSFGTIAKSTGMPLHLKNSFREAFRSFPEVTFIWKYEADDDYAADLPNVIKKKWVPQLDLLGHPNLLAFVSHCGQNSLGESISQGVPLVCIPLFGDQMHNARAVAKRNIGIHINKNDLSSEKLKDALDKILHHHRYRQASQRLQQMIQNKPFPPRERLLRYIEFAVKYGPIDNFDIASNNLSFVQYYLLDIIIPLLLVSLVIVYIVLRLILHVIRKLISLTKLKTE